MAGAHVAAHAAAEEEKKKKQEEEEMTNYTQDELINEYEFKILRSINNKFKHRDVIEKIKEEEGMAGWIMVEKFDDGRIRFKRPLSAQQKDVLLPQGLNPYRTRYGMSEGGMALWVLGVLAIIGGIIGFLVMLLK